MWKRPCCQNSIYSNGDLDLWPNDPKINRILLLPQWNHVPKFGKDPIYRTKIIVWKPVWTPAHPPAITNHIIRPVCIWAYKKGCTRLTATTDKVYQLLANGRWFSPGTPASATTKSGRHDIAEILLKVALNTINQSINQYIEVPSKAGLTVHIHCTASQYNSLLFTFVIQRVSFKTDTLMNF